jgi:hypothetical protein
MVLQELPKGLQGIIDPAALNASLPSFVLPYFYYLQDKRAGDVVTAAAWSKSVVPGIIILVIVVLSLLLAWWAQRKGRAALQPVVQQTGTSAFATGAPIEGAPQPSESLIVPVSQERQDEAQPTYPA